MPLYLVTAAQHGYDMLNAVVVRAPDAKAAREIAATAEPQESERGRILSHTGATVELLSEDGPTAIILADVAWG